MQVRTDIHVSDDALLGVCRRFHASTLELFGSSARGDFRPDSDIDLLVQYSAGSAVSLLDHLAFQDALTRLFGHPVDLVSRRALRPALARAVLQDARVLVAT